MGEVRKSKGKSCPRCGERLRSAATVCHACNTVIDMPFRSLGIRIALVLSMLTIVLGVIGLFLFLISRR